MGEVADTPSMTTDTRMPCKALLAADDHRKEDRAGSSGLTFKSPKGTQEFSAEVRASKLIRNKTAYEMWFMALR